MSDSTLAFFITYILLLLGVSIFVGRKNIALFYISLVVFALIGYLIHVPYFGISLMVVAIMSVAGIIVYYFIFKEN